MRTFITRAATLTFFAQRGFPSYLIRWHGTAAQRKVMLFLPGVREDARRSVRLFSTSSPPALIPWNPFRYVQVATHSVRYPPSKRFDIEEINQTEFDAVKFFMEAAQKNDHTLKVFVGGEDTHIDMGDLEDFIAKLNFWREQVQTPQSLIAQLSANYYKVGLDQYINASIVADFTRGKVHCLIKRAVANLDRFNDSPEKMVKGTPRVMSIGEVNIGSAICLDSHELAEMLACAPGNYKIAILSSFGDPSGASAYRQKTLRIIQDHRRVHEGGPSSGRVVKQGRPTSGLLDALYHALFETGPGATQEVPLPRTLEPRAKPREDQVMEVNPEGIATCKKVVVPPPEGLSVVSRLDVSDVLPLEIAGTNPMPSPKSAWAWWAWLRKVEQ